MLLVWCIVTVNPLANLYCVVFRKGEEMLEYLDI